MNEPNLIFIVMPIILAICLVTGIARPLIACGHPRTGLRTLTRPAGTRSAADPDQAPSDPWQPGSCC